MDKNTLSNYGWIVIAVLVLSVMIALATPFGSYIEQGVRATTEGLFNTSKNAVNSAFEDLGVQMDDQTFEEGYTTPSNNKEYDHNAPELHPKGTIPMNATYYDKSSQETLTYGQSFPDVAESYDKYTYGDYIYTYSEGDGWDVSINNQVVTTKQKTYGKILETINGNPITTIERTFQDQTELIIPPILPNSIKNMRYAFLNCSKLTNLSDYIIPNGVTNMFAAFNGCIALTTAPKIPDSVENMHGTFANCQSLITAPIIPHNVNQMLGTFSDCTSLTGTIIINTNNIKKATYQNFESCQECFKNVDMTNITLTGEASKKTLNLIGGTGKNWTDIA